MTPLFKKRPKDNAPGADAQAAAASAAPAANAANAVVVTFHTTSEAMAFRAAAESAQVPQKLISVPRQLAAGCGYAWRAPLETRTQVEELIASRNLEVEGVHEVRL